MPEKPVAEVADSEIAELRHRCRVLEAAITTGWIGAGELHDARKFVHVISTDLKRLRSVVESQQPGRLAELVDDVLEVVGDMARRLNVIQRHHTLEPELDLVELSELVASALADLRDQSRWDDVRFAVRGDERHWVEIDRRRMKVVLRELVANAVEAGARRVTFNVTRGEELGLVRLTVQDDGAGVSELVHDTLFEPWVSTRNSRTGMGLFVVRTLLSGMGCIIAHTEADIGACFELDLPIVESRP